MTTRRDYLKKTIAGSALLSLSGCLDPNNPQDILNGGSSKHSFEETVKDVKLRQTPNSFTGTDSDRTIILSDTLAESLDVEAYEQVRVRTKSNPEIKWQQRSSLYTTRFDADFNTESEENVAWMTQEGLKRQGLGTKENLVDISPFATNPNIETRENAEGLKDIMEQKIAGDNYNSKLIVCAPHGGDILKNSELQALFFSSQEEYNSWLAAGYEYTNNQAYKRFYINPDLINVESFYELNSLSDQEYNYALSFVLLDDFDRDPTVIIGGLAEIELKRVYASKLNDALPSSYKIKIDTNGRYDGTDTRNFVNQISKNGVNGIQIAQTRSVTRTSWRTVANACLEAHKAYTEDD